MVKCFVYEGKAVRFCTDQMVIVSADSKFAFGKVTEIAETPYNSSKTQEKSFYITVDTSFGHYKVRADYLKEGGVEVRRTIPVFDEFDRVSFNSNSVDIYEISQDTMSLISRMIENKSSAESTKRSLETEITHLKSALEAIGRGTNKFPEEMKNLMQKLATALDKK